VVVGGYNGTNLKSVEVLGIELNEFLTLSILNLHVKKSFIRLFFYMPHFGYLYFSYFSTMSQNWV